jgi:hypothetical protein
MKKSIILFLALVLIVPLAMSCVTIQVPVVETYSETEYKTEYRTEPATETVNTVISSKEGTTYLSPQMKWYTDVLLAGAEGGGGTYYYNYVIVSSHSKNQVQITLSTNAKYENGEVRVYDLSRVGPIPPRPTTYKKFLYQPSDIDWLNNLNTVISSSPLLGQVQLGSNTAGQITFDAAGVTDFGIFATTWDAYVIRSVKLLWTDEVLGTKTITTEKQVPYQVPYQVEKQRTVYKTETVPFWQAISGK